MGKENILSVGVKSFSTPGNVVPLFRTGPLRTGATWFLQMPTFTNADSFSNQTPSLQGKRSLWNIGHKQSPLTIPGK